MAITALHGKNMFNKSDMTRDISLFGNGIKTEVGRLAGGVTKKKTWCGSGVKFGSIVRPQPRVA